MVKFSWALPTETLGRSLEGKSNLRRVLMFDRSVLIFFLAIAALLVASFPSDGREADPWDEDHLANRYSDPAGEGTTKYLMAHESKNGKGSGESRGSGRPVESEKHERSSWRDKATGVQPRQHDLSPVPQSPDHGGSNPWSSFFDIFGGCPEGPCPPQTGGNSETQ
jgi:hypothetical protein